MYIRDAFRGNDDEDKPAHIFLRSVHHIPIERGWLDLRKDVGHGVILIWESGSRLFRENDPLHRYLCCILTLLP
jgi:hypothetical protein